MTSRSKSPASGFTLLEMLVVIAIMGVTLALLANFRPPHSQRLQTQASARQVAQALRQARGQAIAEGHAVTPQLPKPLAGVAQTVQAPPGGIVFSPDGSASGGQVQLGNGAGQITVGVDWLTGTVSSHGP